MSRKAEKRPLDGDDNAASPSKKDKRQKERGLSDIYAHVALKVSYIGENYHGFVSQEGSTDTVEVCGHC